jgi:hypothetical protein
VTSVILPGIKLLETSDGCISVLTTLRIVPVGSINGKKGSYIGLHFTALFYSRLSVKVKSDYQETSACHLQGFITEF